MGAKGDTEPTREADRDLPPVTVVAGTDDYGKREALTRLRRAFFADGQEGDEVVLDGEGADFEALGRTALEELRTRPLGGGRKLVVIRQADGLAQEKRDLLLGYLEAPASFSRLILVVRSLGGGRNRLRERLKQSEAYLVFERPRDSVAPWEQGRSSTDTELNRWLVGRARELGLRIRPAVAAAVTERVGNNRAELEALLERWIMMRGPDTEIGPDVLDALSGRHREVDMFGLVDAIMERDAAEVLKILNCMFSEGLMIGKDRLSAPRDMFVPLIAVLFRRMRQTEQFRRRLAAGEPARAAADALGIRSFAVSRAVNEARRFTGAELRFGIERLLEADRRFKYGRQPAESSLVDLVLDVVRGHDLARRRIV